MRAPYKELSNINEYFADLSGDINHYANVVFGEEATLTHWGRRKIATHGLLYLLFEEARTMLGLPVSHSDEEDPDRLIKVDVRDGFYVPAAEEVKTGADIQVRDGLQHERKLAVMQGDIQGVDLAYVTTKTSVGGHELTMHRVDFCLTLGSVALLNRGEQSFDEVLVPFTANNRIVLP